MYRSALKTQKLLQGVIPDPILQMSKLKLPEGLSTSFQDKI